MALTPGTRLGPYEIVSALGEGGMGEVYRATDTKLKRQVAIKILPASLAADRDRLARFQREAEVLASLNHPNIAGIYGIEETNGSQALIMELVEGEDLSALIARGPVSLSDALPLARQIAEALEAAHEQGIIHRDLKPANIKLKGAWGPTPTRLTDGRLEPTLSASDVAGCTVKVLDFGLAKALDPAGASGPSASALANSPTMTSPAMTQMGMILGTAAYMSPEQARGRAVDRRADIWAFGVVLYEMLTGKRAFDGESIVDVLGAVARLEPDFDALPPDVPPRVRRVLQLCLKKDVRQRAQSIGDVRLALEGAFETTAPTATPAAVSVTPAAARARLPWAVAAIGLIAAAGLTIPAMRHLLETPPPVLPSRFDVAMPSTTQSSQVVLSPSGRLLALTSAEAGPTRLWVRPLDSLDARVLPGTENAELPFWSSDEKHLGFFAEGKLKKIAVAGGPAETICDAPTPRGGTWMRDGTIVFAPTILGALFQVPENGGAPAQLTKPNGPNESHRFPVAIEGGPRFLFQNSSPVPGASGIHVGSLDGGTPVRLLPDTGRALYVPPTAGARTGAVLFTRETTVMALPVDAQTLAAVGGAVPVAQDVAQWGGLAGNGAFTASDSGVLLYRRGSNATDSSLVWLDRSGKQIGPPMDRNTFDPGPSVTLSPDGARAAVTVRTSLTTSDVWLVDLARGVPTRFTFGPGRRRGPVWTPDGSAVVFVALGGATAGDDIFRKPANGAGAETRLFHAGSNATPLDISSDGTRLAYTTTGGTTKDDIWIASLQGGATPEKFLNGPFEERHAQFSPDGHWIAYSSDESGPFQVYVQATPATGAKQQISTQGGSRPRWRRDGREIYYIATDGTLMAAPVTLGAGTLQVGSPVPLFEIPRVFSGGRAIPYGPSPDGQKFLVLMADDDSREKLPVTIWTNWMAGLGQ